MTARNSYTLLKFNILSRHPFFLTLILGGLLITIAASADVTDSKQRIDSAGTGVTNAVLASDYQSGSLNFDEFVTKLIAQNGRIQSGRLRWGIASTAVTNAESEFQLTFSASYQREGSKTRNTVEESLARSTLSEYEKLNDTYKMTFSKKTGIGATVQLSSTLSAVKNSLQPSSLLNGEHKTFYGLSVSQPLLRNVGVKANTARIRMSESDRSIAYQRFRQETMQVLNRGSEAYWDLYLNQEVKKIIEDSLTITQKLLKDLQLRESLGRARRTDVLDAESGVSLRKALLAQSRRSLHMAENRLASLLVEGRAKMGSINATEKLSVSKVDYDHAATIRKALAVNPLYLSSLEQAKKEDIRIVYAKNQRYPELNLLASYGFNGLGDHTPSSLVDLDEKDHPTWVVGLQLKMAVGKDKKSSSELSAAKMRKQEALLNVKAAEVATINDIDSAINEIEILYEEYLQVKAVMESNEKLFEIESDRRRTGTSTVRLVLEREMELNQAIKNAMEVKVSYRAAQTALRILDGTILADLGLHEHEPQFIGSIGPEKKGRIFGRHR